MKATSTYLKRKIFLIATKRGGGKAEKTRGGT